MWPHAFVTVILGLYAMHGEASEPKWHCSESVNRALDVSISQTSVCISDTAFRLRYQILNGLEEDIWLCQEVSIDRAGLDVYVADDGETLVVRRRVASGYGAEWDIPPMATYRRLGSKESRTESVVLPLPVTLIGPFAREEPADGLIHVTNVVVEIGFHVGNMFERLLDVYRQEQPNDVRDFTLLNEGLGDRREKLVVRWPIPLHETEQVLRMDVTRQRIPYVRGRPRRSVEVSRIGLSTRCEIHYEPSALDYFFPYRRQQKLLSEVERAHLASQSAVAITDADSIGMIESQLWKHRPVPGAVACDASRARITWILDSQAVATVTVYGDEVVETSGSARLLYGFGMGALRAITPEIQPYEGRIRCAANLEDIWNRLGVYSIVERGNAATQSCERTRARPEPTRWCDALAEVFGRFGSKRLWPETPLYSCPSAGPGECHYAMNPSCEPDSPGDMVLLFETKAGWNQHGGPELFTFDHHDLRGGCVLLNDGTVKFIRTEEELHALRWE